jgi:hypothetical protein
MTNPLWYWSGDAFRLTLAGLVVFWVAICLGALYLSARLDWLNAPEDDDAAG